MINLNNLTTVAAVDSAISHAEMRRGIFYHKRSVNQDQMENADALSDTLPAQLEDLLIQLEGAANYANTLPAGTNQVYWAKQVQELTVKKAKLEQKIANSDPETIQDKMALDGEYGVCIEFYDQYIADLNALKAQLTAAAA